MQENQRYADAKLGSLGFETLKYKSAPLVFDGAATGLTGAYYLNTKYMKFEIYSGRNFESLDLPDQISRHGRRDPPPRFHGGADAVQSLDAGQAHRNRYLTS